MGKMLLNLIVVLSAVIMIAATVSAEDKLVKPSPPAPAAASSVNGITQAAVKSGVLACTSRVNQVANFLTAGSQGVGAVLFIPPDNPDQQMISVSMEIPSADASSAYASASFAPNQANGCGGMYETVVYWQQKCDEVAGRNFGTLKKIDLFSKNIMTLDGGLTTKIFLMPAGTGCVSIKKEVVR